MCALTNVISFHLDLVNNACLAVDEKMGNIALEEKIRDVNLHEQD